MRLLTLASVFIHAGRRAHVDVAVGIDPAAMASAAVETAQNISLLVQDAEPGGRVVPASLTDVKNAIFVFRDVHGPLNVGPDSLELSILFEDLDSVVLPVAHETRALAINEQTVGQGEMAGLGFAGLTPGCFQLAIRREPVDPRVPVAVGDVEVS